MFTATEFYPTPREKDDGTQPSPMNQCIMSGLPVFARDTGKNAKKAYMACGYEHFCFKFYEPDSDRTRHFYELLQMEKPTKIYLDFDYDDVTKKTDFIEKSNEFIKAIITEIGKEVPVYILEASTDKKLSRHVIFEYFLQDIPSVQALVEYTNQCKCDCEYLDRKVYTRNRLFRLLYSYKAGKDPSSALSINGDLKYNPFNVFRTMIQAKLPPHYQGPFDSIKDSLADCVSFVNLKNVSGGGGTNGYVGYSSKREAPAGIDDFVAAFSNDGVILTYKENENFISCVVGGKQCPWIQKMHKHNNQYLTICKSTMKGFFQCADPECADEQHGLIPYGNIDVSFLWKQNYQSL